MKSIPIEKRVYYNACTEPCDMYEGPCACGAWHTAEERLEDKKLIRNTSDEESRAFWASVKKSAEPMRTAPAWLKAGIDINEKNFITYRPNK